MIYFIGPQSVLKEYDGINYATMEECVAYCSNKTVLGVDTETEGYFNFKKKIVMLQIGDKENQYVIDVRHTDISPLKPILESFKITKLFWNAKFDYKFLKFHGIEVQGIYDGMLVEVILNNGYDISYSLEVACLKYCNKQLDKSTRNQFVGLQGEPFTLKQIVYGAEDVENLITIKDKQDIELKDKELEVASRLENRFVKVLSEIEYAGFYLNPDKWLLLDNKNKDKKDKAREILDEYVLQNNHSDFIDYQLSLFDTGYRCAINWDSPSQVIEYLKFLGIDTKVKDKSTGGLKDSCEEKHISKFAKEFEFIPLYLTYKKWAKSVSTYGLEFLNHINKNTGRIHSNYWQIVTTGRMSSNDPNLQNIPAEEDFRMCFEGQGDNMLVVADYSGQEQKVVADQCLDPSLVDFHLNGDGDMHCLVTRKVFPEVANLTTKEIKENHKDKRNFAKTIGFALNYGGSEHTIADRLQIPVDEAKTLVEAYFAGFPDMTKHFEQVTKETMNNGYILIDNVTKRKFFIKDFDKLKDLEKRFTPEFWEKYRINKEPYKQMVREYFVTKGKIQRWSQNMPVQGTSGSMTKTAAIMIYDRLTKMQLHDSIKIVNIIHDEIVLESKPDTIEVASSIITECMESAGSVFCKTIPMIATSVVSKYWTH